MTEIGTKTKRGPVPGARALLEEYRERLSKFAEWKDRVETRLTDLEQREPATAEPVLDAIPPDLVLSLFETGHAAGPDDTDLVRANATLLNNVQSPEMARHLAAVVQANDELMAVVLAFAMEGYQAGEFSMNYPENTHDSAGQPLEVKWPELAGFVNTLVKDGGITVNRCKLIVYELLRCRALYVLHGRILVNKTMHRAMMVAR